MGQGSKMIVTGDPSQSDIGEDSGFEDCVQRLKPAPGVGTVLFEDEHIVRHKMVSAMLKALS
jgi:phosphate starvation-inducible PhoH-like protein